MPCSASMASANLPSATSRAARACASKTAAVRHHGQRRGLGPRLGSGQEPGGGQPVLVARASAAPAASERCPPPARRARRRAAPFRAPGLRSASAVSSTTGIGTMVSPASRTSRLRLGGQRERRRRAQAVIGRHRLGIERPRQHGAVGVVEHGAQRAAVQAAGHRRAHQVQDGRRHVGQLHRGGDAPAGERAARLLDDERHAQRRVVEPRAHLRRAAAADDEDRRRRRRCPAP